MSKRPIVTGISPKEGPPGTRVTIRGENLGTRASDLIGLKICGCDCLLAAEWKFPKKIIVRTGPAKGVGDVIVTTLSGGEGTCTVQFRAYHETIGPLKESAVWIEESPNQNIAWGRRSLTQSVLMQDDPLGLSTEGNERQIDDLHELLPDCSGNLAYENFSPAWLLLENHAATSFQDLKAGLAYLKRKVENQKEGQLSFLKSNAGAVLEQLDTLVHIREKLGEHQLLDGNDNLNVLQQTLKKSITDSQNIFLEVLQRREKADSTRGLLFALSRHKFLLCLPNTVHIKAQAGEYDIVLNDYMRAKNLFGKTEIPFFRQVLEEVDKSVLQIRKQLHEKAVKMPQTIEQQKKLIKALTNLEAQQKDLTFNEKIPSCDTAWESIEARAKFLEKTLKETFELFANKDSNGQDKNKSREANPLPARMLFCEEICNIAASQLPDLWRLGQLYFTGELGGAHERNPAGFKRIILNIIESFCAYLRIAVLIGSDLRSARQNTGVSWPLGSASSSHQFLQWVPQCLRFLRITYSVFISLDLPSEALDKIQILVNEMRLYCFSILFKRATERCKKLLDEETWDMGMEEFPGVTNIPEKMRTILVEILDELQDACMKNEVREENLFEPESDGQRELTQRLQEFLSTFCSVIEELAYQQFQDEGPTPLYNVSQLLGYPRMQHDSMTAHDNYNGAAVISWEQRMLCCLANCAYCNKHLFPEIGETFVKYGYPLPTLAIESARYAVNNLFANLLETYVEHKSDPLVGTIEPSMYMHSFQWDKQVPHTTLSPYAHECCSNLVGVYSEIFTISPALLREILEPIVLTVSEELARLMSCVQKFSYTGAIRANVDIRLLHNALRNYTCSTAKNYFLEALEAIKPPLNSEQQREADEVLQKVMTGMRLQLMCFTVKEHMK